MKNWRNLYADGDSSSAHSCPKQAQLEATWHDWQRVEERWNGHAILPCVGMSAEQASHEWRISNPWGSPEWNLEPRQ